MKSLLTLFLILAGFIGQAQLSQKQCKVIRDFVRILHENHYSEFSYDAEKEKLFKSELLKLLDAQKLYFTQASIEQTDKLNLNIENLQSNSDYAALNRFLDIFKTQLKASKEILENIDTKSIKLNNICPLNKEMSYDFYVSDKAEQKARFIDYLKTKAVETDFFIPKPDSVKHNILEDAVQRELCKINKLNSNDKLTEYFIVSLLNSYAFLYDPHSNYFSMSEMSIFLTMLSSSDYSFGINFSADQNRNIVVESLSPGGPAWNSHQINTGDKLIEISHNNLCISDSACFDLSDAYMIIYNPEYSVLDFKFKKKNGEIYTVKLLKEIIKNTDNTIEAYILSGTKKIGYVQLNDFYTSDNKTEKGGCAQDVAAEIIRLKKENIEALILDLRNNGGGAVNEAVDLAGLFIDYGVVALQEDRNRKITYLKDTKRGTTFKKPLLILVNNYSASASEIFAGAMQDYNRALIVGNTTFGKATAQIMAPVIESPDELDFSDETLGIPAFMKYTTNRIYRITGKSHQLTGIKPDIELPEVSSPFDKTEASYITAFQNNTIKKKVYYTAQKELPISYLQEKLSPRISDIIWKSDSLSGEWDFFFKTEYPTKSDRKGHLAKLKKFEDLLNQTISIYEYEHHEFSISGTKDNIELQKLNPIKAEHYQKYIKDMQKDRYICESYRILCDLINYNDNH